MRIILPIILVAVFSLSQAGLGMTAGVLDYGQMQPGEAKTLSFGVFIDDNESASFTVEPPRGLPVTVSPQAGILEPRQMQWINVTVTTPVNEIGRWEGFVRVTAGAPSASGAANIQLEVAKKIVFSVPGKTEGINVSSTSENAFTQENKTSEEKNNLIADNKTVSQNDQNTALVLLITIVAVALLLYALKKPQSAHRRTHR